MAQPKRTQLRHFVPAHDCPAQWFHTGYISTVVILEKMVAKWLFAAHIRIYSKYTYIYIFIIHIVHVNIYTYKSISTVSLSLSIYIYIYMYPEKTSTSAIVYPPCILYVNNYLHNLWSIIQCN